MSQEPVFKITESMFQQLVEKYEPKEEETAETDPCFESSELQDVKIEKETQDSQSINSDSE